MIKGQSKVLRGLCRDFPSHGRYYFVLSFHAFPLSAKLDTCGGMVEDFVKHLKEKGFFKGFEEALEVFSQSCSCLFFVSVLHSSSFSENRRRGGAVKAIYGD